MFVFHVMKETVDFLEYPASSTYEKGHHIETSGLDSHLDLVAPSDYLLWKPPDHENDQLP